MRPVLLLLLADALLAASLTGREECVLKAREQHHLEVEQCADAKCRKMAGNHYKGKLKKCYAATSNLQRTRMRSASL